MGKFDVDAYIRKLAGVVYKGTTMLGQNQCTPEQYWVFLKDQVQIAARTIATPLEWNQTIPNEGETPADYAKLEGLDPDEAPEEFDI